MTLRERIIQILLRTSLVTVDYSDVQIKKAAKRAGVRVSTLVEARNRYKKLSTRSHTKKYKTELGDAAHPDQEELKIYTSTDIIRILKQGIENRGVSQFLYIRSLVHHYLLRSWDPREIVTDWPLAAGVVYTNGDRDKQRPIKTRVTPAMMTAFRYRAKRLRVAYLDLLRTLLVLAHRGEFAPPGELKYISLAEMYDDVKDYLVHVHTDSADTRYQILQKPKSSDEPLL